MLSQLVNKANKSITNLCTSRFQTTRKSVTQYGSFQSIVPARSFSLSQLQIDYNNPTTQLLEENDKLGYKLYYQQGLQTQQQKQEFDTFNDPIWYGRQGHEIVARIKDMSKDIQSSDLFIMRDYHNNQIVGANAIKRISSTIDTILNTNKYGNDTFNFTIRRNTTISPSMQGKGYGRIIRKYSRDLDDLHVNSAKYGLSITDVQIKNEASLKLQLNTGFEIVSKGNAFQYYRPNTDKFAVSDKYEVESVDPNDAELWNKITALHQDNIKKYGVIDLSVTPNEIHHEHPVHVIKGKHDGKILAVFQTNLQRIEIKTATLVEKLVINMMSRFCNGMNGEETDFPMCYISPLYIDYENEECDMKDAVRELVSYCLYKRGLNFGATIIDIKHPFNKLVKENERAICGIAGSIMSQKETLNLLVRFNGFNEEQLDYIKLRPITTKLPQILCG